ncbi:unnamed protein product [Mesocestoides corti]|uniref:Uncharacterized protein n=2 Tax=Mesocestoides corti TaxID=53468 RepID=A0A0R3UBI2_MESCO|nr:unnamed protein product [Mesocestoides corti]
MMVKEKKEGRKQGDVAAPVVGKRAHTHTHAQLIVPRPSCRPPSPPPPPREACTPIDSAGKRVLEPRQTTSCVRKDNDTAELGAVLYEGIAVATAAHTSVIKTGLGVAETNESGVQETTNNRIALRVVTSPQLWTVLIRLVTQTPG